MSRALLPVPVCLLLACATFVPNTRGVYVAESAQTGVPDAIVVAAFVGDIGARRTETPRLVANLARRLADAPDAPVIVLGDLFYGDGLLGGCDDERWRSRKGCDEQRSPEDQRDTVLGPYRDALGERAFVALAGNHDHYGGATARQNACDLLPRLHPRWRYLGRGCGLDAEHPVDVIDLGDVAIFALDSDPMIQDAAYRRASVAALEAALRQHREKHPGARRVVAAHHALESYGEHNGAGVPLALMKDLYWLRTTLLLPLNWWVERRYGQQNLYEWRYRSYRRDLYRVFEREPVDLFAAGHDHNLQHVAIERAGLRDQIVSGSGAMRDPIKRFGLDLYWSNRLARVLGLGETLPSPRHRLRFGFGGSYDARERSGYGFAVLTRSEDRLQVEFWDARSQAPLHVARIEGVAAGTPSSE